MLRESRGEVDDLLLMDDLKLYDKTKQELDSLLQTVRMSSRDIEMKLEISKCAMLEIKRGKVVQTKEQNYRVEKQ